MIWEQIYNLFTSEGKILSAAQRGTEKPPWVRVSLAVNVLKKTSDCVLHVVSPWSDASSESLLFFNRQREKKTLLVHLTVSNQSQSTKKTITQNPTLTHM